jgi:uncharacterized cupredoxin-like copper-binding protein
MPRQLSRLAGLLCACAATALVFAGCGSSHPAGRGAQQVDVTERDFHITAPTTISAGEVVFQVHNAGPDEHEFIVMRGGASQLPVRSDGLTINEDSVKSRLVGELEPGAPGLTRDLHLKLAPGRYVFFCDMTGHFMGGMHTEVEVQ